MLTGNSESGEIRDFGRVDLLTFERLETFVMRPTEVHKPEVPRDQLLCSPGPFDNYSITHETYVRGLDQKCRGFNLHGHPSSLSFCQVLT